MPHGGMASGLSGDEGSPRPLAQTWCGQRMTAKPFQHDAVRLLRSFLEDGVANTAQHDKFGTAQSALQHIGGARTERASISATAPPCECATMSASIRSSASMIAAMRLAVASARRPARRPVVIFPFSPCRFDPKDLSRRYT
jgi:hypothetical protein